MDDIYRQPSLTPSKRDLQYVTKVDELMEGSYSSPVFRRAYLSWLNVNSVSTRGSYGLFIDN